jgi:hypothetical protein
MNSSLFLSAFLFFFSWNALALNPSESNLINRLSLAVKDYTNIRTNLSCAAEEHLHCQNTQNAVLSQVLAHAFSDQRYDRADSFLSEILKKAEFPRSIIGTICTEQFLGRPISNSERSRLYNFMIRSFYENRSSIPDYHRRIHSVLFVSDCSEVYNQETRKIVKELILQSKLHFMYADVIGITSDKEMHDFLWQVVKESETRNSFNRSCLGWLAVVMLAKSGDEVARKRVEVTADELSDINRAWIVTRGLAYIGDRSMVVRLFKMLESDKKKWHGNDVIPKETQVSQEAATALSLCVKDFPTYDPLFPVDFSLEDKKKCIKWAEEHKNTFVVANQKPLHYLRNAGFFSVWNW